MDFRRNSTGFVDDRKVEVLRGLPVWFTVQERSRYCKRYHKKAEQNQTEMFRQ